MNRLIQENDIYALFKPNGTAQLHVADIDQLPRVEAEPVVHAAWVYKRIFGSDWSMLCCSHCLETEGAHSTYDYCPNCGAKMDAEGF